MSKTTNYQLDKYDDNTNCDFRFINGSLDKLDEELKNVSDKADKREIIIKDITISKAGWKYTSPNLYYYEINADNITGKDSVDINISVNNTINGDADDLLTSTVCATSFCRIYSRAIPKVDLKATMIIQKGV